MKYVPHDYQAYATDFILTHPEAAVLLDMGLGKSVITLTAIQELCLDAFEISRVLVIAPLRVARDTWPAELQKWDHLQGLSYSVAVGNEKERLAALMRPAFLHIINRENVQWLVEDSGLPFRYDMIVIDELSSFKSWQAKRFKSLLKVRPSVKRIVGLTGTPSSNGLMDLWAEFRLLDMGQRLGRFITRYREAYFVPDKRSMQQIFSYKPRPGAEDEIYRKIGDITISMRATDHLKMPECIMNRVLVSMSEDEQQVYDQMKEQLIVQVKGKEIDAVNAAALSGKLCQMANGAVYAEEKDTVQIHDRKLDALEDLIEGANGKPLLVAYWFKHDLKRIQERFPAAREIRTSKGIADWNDGRIPLAVMMATLKEMSTKTTSIMQDDVVSHTRNVHSMEDAIAKMVDMQTEINADIDQLIDKKQEIMHTIYAVENPEYQTLLELRYICFRSWEEIADKMHCTVSNVFKVHSKALRCVAVPKLGS